MALFLDPAHIVLPPQALDMPPRLGVDSLLRRTLATVTASAETTGFEKENGYAEGFTFDFWKPGAAGVNWLRASLPAAELSNYVGVAGHNLHLVGGSVKMQHSTDGGSTWSDSSAEHAPGDSAPLMILYDDIHAADHRLWINSDLPPSIAAVSFGEVLKLDAPVQAPWAPPALSRKNRYIGDVSENGAFLGRTIVAEGAELNLTVRGVGMPWVRGRWEETVRLLENWPFFFAARGGFLVSGASEIEVFYGWAEDQPSARYSTNVYGSIKLKARGIVS